MSSAVLLHHSCAEIYCPINFFTSSYTIVIDYGDSSELGLWHLQHRISHVFGVPSALIQLFVFKGRPQGKNLTLYHYKSKEVLHRKIKNESLSALCIPSIPPTEPGGGCTRESNGS
jgi:hypothetical protein